MDTAPIGQKTKKTFFFLVEYVLNSFEVAFRAILTHEYKNSTKHHHEARWRLFSVHWMPKPLKMFHPNYSTHEKKQCFVFFDQLALCPIHTNVLNI